MAALPLVGALLLSGPAQAVPNILPPAAIVAGGSRNEPIDTDGLKAQQDRHASPPEMGRQTPGPIDDDVVQPGAPMPVPSGAFGYLATRDATRWLAAQRPGEAIRALPVPPQYRPANTALATQMTRELDAAVRTPGACVQIIIDLQSSAGNLFDYGVWSVERQYCPR